MDAASVHGNMGFKLLVVVVNVRTCWGFGDCKIAFSAVFVVTGVMKKLTGITSCACRGGISFLLCVGCLAWLGSAWFGEPNRARAEGVFALLHGSDLVRLGLARFGLALRFEPAKLHQRKQNDQKNNEP